MNDQSDERPGTSRSGQLVEGSGGEITSVKCPGVPLPDMSTQTNSPIEQIGSPNGDKPEEDSPGVKQRLIRCHQRLKTSIKENTIEFATFLLPFYVLSTVLALKPYSVYKRNCCCGKRAKAKYSYVGVVFNLIGIALMTVLLILELGFFINTFLVTKSLLGRATSWAFQGLLLCFALLLNLCYLLINNKHYRDLFVSLNELRIMKQSRRHRFVVFFYIAALVSIVLPISLASVFPDSSANEADTEQNSDTIVLLAKSLCLGMQVVLQLFLLLSSLNFMGVAIFLGLCFKEHALQFAKDFHGVQLSRLRNSFDRYCELREIVQRVDGLFSHIICVNVFSIIVILCLQSYSLVSCVIKGTSTFGTLAILALIMSIFLLTWFALSVFPAIYLNEKSRQIKETLLKTFVTTDEMQQAVGLTRCHQRLKTSIKENSIEFATFLLPFYVMSTVLALKPYSVYKRNCCCGKRAKAKYSYVGLVCNLIWIAIVTGLLLVELYLSISTFLVTKRLLGQATSWAFQGCLLCFALLLNLCSLLLNTEHYHDLFVSLNRLRIMKQSRRHCFVAFFYIAALVSTLVPLLVGTVFRASSVNEADEAEAEQSSNLVQLFKSGNNAQIVSFAKTQYLHMQVVLNLFLLFSSLNFMGVAIFLGLCFKEHALQFAKEFRGVQLSRLRNSFDRFCELREIVQQVDGLFSNIICLNVFSTIGILALQSYSLVGGFIDDISTDPSGTNLTVSAVTASIFLLTWFALTVFPAIYLNGKSRQIKETLLKTFVTTNEMKQAKDQFLQTLDNRDWGITVGKFFLLDRSAFLTLTGMIFTFLVVWIKLNK